MKSFTLLAFAGLAAAQLTALPECAQTCASSYLANGIGDCGSSDVACICANSEFIGDIACCLLATGGCDTADQSSAMVFASQLCAAEGVTVPTAVSCTTSATGDATAASTATATAAATGTDTTAATGSTATAATATATGGTSTSTAWAARESAGVKGGLLGGVIAALAML